ncbi:hypothetical protein N9D31_03890, partial [Oligoflexaceae bacterium]|nr:hypothetical protein [Oligoflexaceae bacterium]
NTNGLMGLGHADYVSTPTLIPGSTGFIDFSARGFDHSCIIRSDRTVWCAGKNSDGQLGNGTNANSDVFVETAGANRITTGAKIVTGPVKVRTGTCVVLTDGQVKCWGTGEYGTIGDGSIGNTNMPGNSAIGITDAIQIYVSNGSACALRASGEVWCWGYNGDGRLGIGSSVTTTTPTKVVGLSDVVMSTHSPSGSLCGLKSDGSVHCWGNATIYGLGDGTFQSDSLAARIPGLPMISEIFTAGRSIVAIDFEGKLWFWGTGSAMGTQPIADWRDPRFLDKSTELHASSGGACRLTESGRVHCQGSNRYGTLGNGSLGGLQKTYEDVGLSGVSVLSSHYLGYCAYKSPDIYCWGLLTDGLAGNGSTSNLSAPVPTKVLTMPNVTDLSYNFSSQCALLSDKTVKCWGNNEGGQLGDGTTVDRGTAVTVTGLTNIKQISGGARFNCALNEAGQVYCWGQNGVGQLGDGTSVSKSSPVLVSGLPEIKQISMNTLTTSCALSVAGDVYCWGSNVSGILSSDPELKSSLLPLRVEDSAGMTQLATSRDAACSIDAKGSLYCWGITENEVIENPDLNTKFTGLSKVTAIQDIVKISATLWGFTIEQSSGKVFVVGEYAVEGALPFFTKATAFLELED